MTPAVAEFLQLATASVAGGAGCALRVVVRDALAGLGIRSWWTIAAVNASGAFAMGAMQGAIRSPEETAGGVIAAILVGLLAGWTTYSAFSWDFVRLWTTGRRMSAAALWTATMVGAPLLAVVGAALAAAPGGGSP